MQLSVHTNELKICVYKKPAHTDVHSSFIHNCQNFKVIIMSFNRWMDKQIVVYSYNWNITQ